MAFFYIIHAGENRGNISQQMNEHMAAEGCLFTRICVHLY